MPGFLSNVFDVTDDDQSASNSQSLGVTDEVGIDESYTVEGSQSASFTDADGTTHSYSNSQELTVDVNTHATIGVAADTAQDVTSGGLDF